MTYADKYAHSIDDIPQTSHWAIMSLQCIEIPGDERSRNCPGHGYPAHTVRLFNYEVYLTEEKWKQAVSERASRHGQAGTFRAMRVLPATLEVKVSIGVNIEGGQ